MIADRESLAWAGGLFEGEGCFSFWKSKDRGEKVYLHTSVSSTDEDVVRKFHKIVEWEPSEGHSATARTNRIGRGALVPSKGINSLWRCCGLGCAHGAGPRRSSL